DLPCLRSPRPPQKAAEVESNGSSHVAKNSRWQGRRLRRKNIHAESVLRFGFKTGKHAPTDSDRQRETHCGAGKRRAKQRRKRRAISCFLRLLSFPDLTPDIRSEVGRWPMCRQVTNPL